MAAGEYASEFWSNVAADRAWLNEHQSQNLIDEPIWLLDVRGDSRFRANLPLWTREPFDMFDRSIASESSAWGLLTSWYRAILPNSISATPKSAFGETVDREILSLPSRFWVEGESDDIMRRLADGISAGDLKRYTETARSEEPERTEKSNSVHAHSDEPTKLDHLSRRPFALALVERMDEVRTKGGAEGFAVHLHGPWGVGKSSILLMMEQIMSDTSTQRLVAGRSFEFNAWQHENRNPPWWPMMEAIKDECIRGLMRNGRFFSALDLKIQWRVWKVGAEWLPSTISASRLWHRSGAFVEGRQSKRRRQNGAVDRSLRHSDQSRIFSRRGLRCLCLGRPFYCVWIAQRRKRVFRFLTRPAFPNQAQISQSTFYCEATGGCSD